MQWCMYPQHPDLPYQRGQEARSDFGQDLPSGLVGLPRQQWQEDRLGMRPGADRP